MASTNEAGVTGRGARRSGAELAGGGAGVRSSGGGSDWRDEDVITVVDQVGGDQDIRLSEGHVPPLFEYI